MADWLHTASRYLVVVGCTALLPPAVARGQDVATSFEGLRERVKPGDTIYITDTLGATSKGRLLDVSPSSLQVQLAGRTSPPIALHERDVNNIALRRSDSLWNGMLVGFASGAAPVALFGLMASAPAGELAQVAAGYGSFGLAIGLLVDIFNKDRTTVYVGAAPIGTPRVRVDVHPLGWMGAQVLVEF